MLPMWSLVMIKTIFLAKVNFMKVRLICSYEDGEKFVAASQMEANFGIFEDDDNVTEDDEDDLDYKDPNVKVPMC